MKIEYDKEADAIYIRTKRASIKRTQRVRPNLLIDIDAKGEVRGIEILNASRWLSEKQPTVEVGKRRIPLPAFT